MGKLETANTLVQIAKTIFDAGVAVADARRRQREEEDRKRKEQEASDKDKRIAILEAECAQLKASHS